ncbi:MAG: hypothetical protein COV44_09160 [Deltaproteobacteria bacterium CG11_big_fil_rev_8_21_14_0_20_45_16]|nr:MAG: hypothetical protein COV44_09160 [Deltaproteobacteria bacterium CG11_big_fil_rev_8_21_14_0_20_45_16]
MSDTNKNPKTGLDFINDLIESEDLPVIEAPQEHEKFELKALPEALEAERQRKLFESRREFNRAENSSAELNLNFTSEVQFARQYIQNISLGGLFVKTNLKREIGSILPVDFTVSVKGVPKKFQLKAKVCRQAEDGLGLQFIEMSSDIRAELEEFIRDILPPGQQVINPSAAKASIERLEKSRLEKEKERKRKQRIYIQIACLVAMISVNIYVAQDLVLKNLNPPETKSQSFQLGNKQIQLNELKSFKKDSRKGLILKLADGSELVVPEKSVESEKLPAHLRVPYRALRNTKLKYRRKSGSVSHSIKRQR